MPLDIEIHSDLLDYFRQTHRIDPSTKIRAQTLNGGVSNRTVRVELSDGRQWVIKQALEKLRVAVDWYSDPNRIHREALGLRHLAVLCPPGSITPLVFEDADLHLLAMEAVPSPHANWKTLLLAGDLQMSHVVQFGQLLAAIHNRAREHESNLRPVFDDRSYFESLRLEPYYAYTADQIPSAAFFLRDLIAATRSRCLNLVHGDYSPKNVLIHNDRLILLDHEVIHWGDPAFDLGFALTHLLSKAHHLKNRGPQFAQAIKIFLGAYDLRDDLDKWAVRHTLGCLLARVSGRSPLEYLTESEKTRQRRVVIDLMASVPQSTAELSELFLNRIDRHAQD